MKLTSYVLFFSLFLGCICFIFSMSPAEATDITVGDTGDYQYLQDAINNSNMGDTVYVWAGTYNENVDANESVTIIGNSSSNTTIDGVADDHVIYSSVNWLNISKLNITDAGSGDSGIYSTMNHTHIDNCSFYDNPIDISIIGIADAPYCEDTIVDNCSFDGTSTTTKNLYFEYCNDTDVVTNVFENADDIQYWYCHYGNFTYNNFTSTTASVDISFYEDTKFNIKHNFIRTRGNAGDGLYMSGCQIFNITNNTIRAKYVGVFIGTNAGTEPLPTNFSVYDNIIRADSYPLWIEGQDHIIDNNTIGPDQSANNAGRSVYILTAMTEDYDYPVSNITISNCSITNSADYGLYFAGDSGSQDLFIYDNTFSTITKEAIFVYDIDNMNIINNVISNADDGIYIYDGTTDVSIFDNSITNCVNNGIYINEATDIEVINCDLSGNEYGINVYEDCENILVDNCTFDDCGTYPISTYRYNAGPFVIENSDFINNRDWYGVYLRKIDNLTIANNTFDNNEKSLDLEDIRDTSIYNNTFTDDVDTALIIRPNAWSYPDMGNISVYNNTFTNNYYSLQVSGTGPAYWKHNVSIFSNNFSATLSQSDFMELDGLYDSDIYDNIFIGTSSNTGILFESACDSSNVYGNTITGCSYGIFTSYGENNYIYNNTITSCTSHGIRIQSNLFDNNVIYNNYFSNTNNVYVVSGADNTWNISKTLGTNIINGHYLGGNYWSDYDGVDVSGDGLGDTGLPYTADGDIATGGDYHPLVYTLIARFSYSPSNPIVRETISFTDTSTGLPTSWHWEFGDGTSSQDRHPQHSYTKTGRYTVTLTVKSSSATDECSKTITVGMQLIGPRIPELMPPNYPFGYTIEEIYSIIRGQQMVASSNPVTLVVIDSGIIHREYNNVTLNKISAHYHPFFSDGTDEYGHGTFVNYEIAYLLQLKLTSFKQISYKAFNSEGTTTNQIFLESINNIKQFNPDVVTISAGAIGNPNDVFSQKIKELHDMGIIVVTCAAGNSGPTPSSILSPACSKSAIAIGASDPVRTVPNPLDDMLCLWSSRGPVNGVDEYKPDLVAPGESIRGPWLDGSIIASGTSMATPLLAAGTCVIVSEHKPLIGIVKFLYFWCQGVVPDAYENAIEKSCIDKGDHNGWGCGLIQLDQISNYFFWNLVFLLIIFFAVITLIIIIIYLIYRYRDEIRDRLRV